METFIGFSIVCPQQSVEVGYGQVAELRCTFFDLTRDSGAAQGNPSPSATLPHTTTLTVPAIEPSTAKGWTVQSSHTHLPSNGGDQVEITFRFLTTPLINVDEIAAIVVANYTHPSGQTRNQTLVFHAQVDPYDIAHVDMVVEDKTQKAGQFDVVKYRVVVTNDGVFPDSYRFEVSGPPGFFVAPPPNLYVPPRENRTAIVTVLTPHGKLYDLGTNGAFTIKVFSTMGTGAYSTTGLLHVEGPYLPSYWIPLTLVGLVSLAVASRSTRESMERHRLEKGKPRPVEISPRQSVLLAELKREDPDAYKSRREQLVAVYRARKERYGDAYREQRAKDKEERKVAKAELAEAKKRRAAEKKLGRAQRKAQRREAALAAKAQKQELREKRKALGKTEKKLEKARRKQAKLDAKQAKLDAKQAKADAKQAKIDERLAAKQAKAAAREAKKAEKAAKREQKP
jgi:hypothetical protein